MHIAVVTAASRDVGWGAAISLAQAGFKVFATGRGITAAGLPNAVVRIRRDYLRDEEIAAVFAPVAAENQ